jgi:hypothetical protein
MAGPTSNDIANQAIVYMGDNQPPVSGNAPNFDTSTAGLALAKFYTPVVQTVGRKFGWDFARNQVVLVPSGNPAPVPWTYEYLYPGIVEVWQLLPPVIADPNNPLPQRWSVGNSQVNDVQTKVIWSNLQNALANYNNAPTEATWDPLFREAVVRLLSSVLAVAIAGKPDTAQQYIESFGVFEGVGEARAD